MVEVLAVNFGNVAPFAVLVCGVLTRASDIRWGSSVSLVAKYCEILSTFSMHSTNRKLKKMAISLKQAPLRVDTEAAIYTATDDHYENSCTRTIYVYQFHFLA